MKETILETKPNLELSNNNENVVIRYAWGCGTTWFITKNKKSFLPNGSRLLFKLECIQTTLPLKTKNSYPSINDVITDIDNNKLLINNLLYC